MNEKTPMRRLPQKQIYQTIGSMEEDLKKLMRSYLKEEAHGEDQIISDLTKVRTFCDELIRWMVL